MTPEIKPAEPELPYFQRIGFSIAESDDQFTVFNEHTGVSATYPNHLREMVECTLTTFASATNLNLRRSLNKYAQGAQPKEPVRTLDDYMRYAVAEAKKPLTISEANRLRELIRDIIVATRNLPLKSLRENLSYENARQLLEACGRTMNDGNPLLATPVVKSFAVACKELAKDKVRSITANRASTVVQTSH